MSLDCQKMECSEVGIVGSTLPEDGCVMDQGEELRGHVRRTFPISFRQTSGGINCDISANKYRQLMAANEIRLAELRSRMDMELEGIARAAVMPKRELPACRRLANLNADTIRGLLDPVGICLLNILYGDDDDRDTAYNLFPAGLIHQVEAKIAEIDERVSAHKAVLLSKEVAKAGLDQKWEPIRKVRLDVVSNSYSSILLVLNGNTTLDMVAEGDELIMTGLYRNGMTSSGEVIMEAAMCTTIRVIGVALQQQKGCKPSAFVEVDTLSTDQFKASRREEVDTIALLRHVSEPVPEVGQIVTFGDKKSDHFQLLFDKSTLQDHGLVNLLVPGETIHIKNIEWVGRKGSLNSGVVGDVTTFNRISVERPSYLPADIGGIFKVDKVEGDGAPCEVEGQGAQSEVRCEGAQSEVEGKSVIKFM